MADGYADARESLRRVLFRQFATGDVENDLRLAPLCRKWALGVVTCCMAGGIPPQRLEMIRTPEELDEFEAELAELEAAS